MVAVGGGQRVGDGHRSLVVGFRDRLFAVVSYLSHPSSRLPSSGWITSSPSTPKEFLATIAGATGVRFEEGNRFDILNNGDEFYPAMLDAIRQAKHSITIEAYIYWAGKVGEQFAQALAETAAEGVRVKILLDAIGSSTIGSRILETLEAGGCQLAWYNPIHWYTLGRFNHRTHRKSLIIDGRLASPGAPGSPITGSDHAEESGRTGATCRSGSRVPPSSRSRPASRRTGCRPRAS